MKDNKDKLRHLPKLDLNNQNFSTKSEKVKSARNNYWCARTPFGLAILSYRQVGSLLRDRRLRQGSYSWPASQKASGSFASFWQRCIISQEGEPLKRLRKLSISTLDENFVKSLKPQFDTIAKILCNNLRKTNKCEFQSAFSIPFSGRAICTLLDLPQEKWRDISLDASTLGLAMGINYKFHEKKINAACDRLMILADELIRACEKGDKKNGLVFRLVSEAYNNQKVTHQDLLDLIVILIFGGVDTTRSQLGFLMALFDKYPSQWSLLKNNHDLVSSAIEEGIRAWPTTTWVTREANQTFEYEGIKIKKGTTLHLLVHSSAKDPALGKLPDFDIKKKQRAHHGFGGGAHYCLGHFVARTDMACALKAIVKTIKNFHIEGNPHYLPDSGNTSPEFLPLKYVLE